MAVGEIGVRKEKKEAVQAGGIKGSRHRRGVKGRGKAMKVAKKYWSVSSKPVKAKKETVRKMWHKK